jgi:ligand-binding sensor domain-containing protein
MKGPILPKIILFVLALSIHFLGCTRQEPAPAPAVSRDYKVSDSFETGSGVVVRALTVDGPHLWVGTSTGVVQTDWKSGELVKTFTIADGLKSNYIFTIKIDRNGTRWFGTDAGGLSRMGGDGWKTYMPQDGLADEWVYDIDFTEDGTAWIGTWDGVSRMDEKGFTTYNVKDGLANKWVYGVAADRDGTLWFGTEEGASHFDPKSGKWFTYTHKDGLGAPNELGLPSKPTRGELHDAGKDKIELEEGRNYEGHYHDLSPMDEKGNDTYNENYIFSILIDRNGDKWFGTWGGGVSRFNGKTWTNYTTKDGLPGNIVYSVAEDSLGQIWAGTHRGVSVFNGTSWKSYTMTDGLIGADVFSVVPDPEGKIWLGQLGGVVQMKEVKG